MNVVIRFSSLGDILQCTAFLNELKKALPSEEIVFVTKEGFSEVLEDQPYVDLVVGLKEGESVFELCKRVPRRVNIVFDLQVDLRSYVLSFLLSPLIIKRVDKHTLYRRNLVWKSNIIGCIVGRRATKDNIEDQVLLLNGSPSYEIKPQLYGVRPIDGYNSPIVGIAPCARWKTKEWGLDKFHALVSVLSYGSVFVFGSKEEYTVGEEFVRGHAGVFNVMGLSLKESMRFMKACDVVVSNDSAAMHMAVALGIPVVAIFGPTVREFGFYPRGVATVIERQLSCRPCSVHGSNECRMGTHECMRSIGVDEVLSVVNRFIGGKHA